MIALIWYVTQHYPKVYLGVFLGVATLPYLMNLPFVHKLTDRMAYLSIVRTAEIIRALCFLVAFLVLKQHLSLLAIVSIAFTKNFAASFFDPVILSIPPRLVGAQSTHRLMSFINACFAIAAIVGPIVAITVSHFYGIKFLFLLAVIAYTISFALLGGVKLSNKESTDKEQHDNTSFLKKLQLVLQKSKSHIGLLIVYSGLMNILLGPLQMLIPLSVKHLLGAGFAHYSGLQIAMGLGAIVGSLLSVFISIRKQQLTGIYGLFCYLSCACFYILLAYQQRYIGSLLAIFGLDVFMGLGNVLIISHYQKCAEDGLLPALMSCVVFISVALSPFAMLIAGMLLKYLDVPTILHAYACGTLIITAIAILFVLRVPQILMGNRRLNT